MRIYAKKLIVSLLLPLLVGGLAGLLIRDGVQAYGALEKPPFSPPAILFPIVWTILYLLMGIGAARVFLSPASALRSRGLRLFLLQIGALFQTGSKQLILPFINLNEFEFDKDNSYTV